MCNSDLYIVVYYVIIVCSVDVHMRTCVCE